MKFSDIRTKIKKNLPALKQQANSVYGILDGMGSNLSKQNDPFWFNPPKPKPIIKHKKRKQAKPRTKIRYVYVQSPRR